MQLFCKEMIKIPFNRKYAISIKNEIKLPDFFRVYHTNDYENMMISSAPHIYKYTLKPPTLKNIIKTYEKKEINTAFEKQGSNKSSGIHIFPDSQLFFFNSLNKSQNQSENKQNSEHFMFYLFINVFILHIAFNKETLVLFQI